MPLTPSCITEEIEEFIREKLSSTEKPIFVNVEPRPESRSLNCVSNVENHIIHHSGEMVLGWHISLWDHILLEAHFHAVWKSSSGNYLDITPYDDAEIPVERVLFVPDKRLKPHERKNMPILRGLSNDPAVQKYIAALQGYYVYDINHTVASVSNGKISYNMVTDDPYKIDNLEAQIHLAKANLKQIEPQIVKRAENRLRRKAQKNAS